MNRFREKFTDEQREEIREEDRVTHLPSRHKETAEERILWNEVSSVTMSEVCERKW